MKEDMVIDLWHRYVKIEIEYNKNDYIGKKYRFKISFEHKKNLNLQDLSIDELDIIQYFISEGATEVVSDEINNRHLEKNKEIFLKKHGFYD